MIRIIILVVALGAGGLAAWAALSMQPRATVAAAPTPVVQKMTDVLVASSELSQGQMLVEDNVRWQPWPEASVTPGLITRTKRKDAPTALKGSLVRSHVLAGEPIREEKLARGNGLLAAVLPSGKRAVAIRVSAESTAGGFILPNDRVDVIQTVKGQGDEAASSRVLLSNIRVLAIDQRADEAKGQAVVVGKTATLELEPAQVEVIAGAQVGALLSLALRSVADNESVAPPPVRAVEAGASVLLVRAGKPEVVKVR